MTDTNPWGDLDISNVQFGKPIKSSQGLAAGSRSPIIARQDDTGTTINASPGWWRTYDYVMSNMVPAKFNGRGLGTAIVNYGYRYGTEPSAEVYTRLAWQVGIDASELAGGGAGGGGGLSAEEKANRIRSLSFTVANQAKLLGINLSTDAVTYIATVAQQQDYTQEQLTSTLANLGAWEELEPGTITTNADDIRNLAREHLVVLSEDSLRDYSRRIASGSMSPETVKNIIQMQAKQAMPWMTSIIDQGLTPTDVLSSGRDRIAQGLEITAGEVDLTDSKYMNMLTVTDEKSGTRLATNSEIDKNVRNDVRWRKTQAAKDTAIGVGQMVARIFGRSTF